MKSTVQSVIGTADPGAAYAALREEIRQAIERVLAGGRFILGPETDAFENEFAAYLGAAEAVTVANGTDAIELALRACDIGPADTVVIPANTVSATAAAAAATGAAIAVADVDAATLTLAPDSLAALLHEDSARRIKAVVPVHLYGFPADLAPIAELTEAHGAVLIEDCAQAHGAVYQGHAVGRWGRAGAFSFYPTKNLGALGDGGGVVTDHPAVAQRVRGLRQYGWRERYVSDEVGANSRLDEIQAAILRAKLPFLQADNERRRSIAQQYTTAFATLPLRLPFEKPGTVSVYHQYVIRTNRREALSAFLREAGILAPVLYPMPIHWQPAYRGRVNLPRAGAPVSEQAASSLLCLPVHAHLSEADAARVIQAVHAFFAEKT